MFAGLRYPTAAASLAGLWLVGRVLYTIGYSTGDADKVCASRFFSVSYFGSKWDYCVQRNTRGGIVGMIGLFGMSHLFVVFRSAVYNNLLYQVLC